MKNKFESEDKQNKNCSKYKCSIDCSKMKMEVEPKALATDFNLNCNLPIKNSKHCLLWLKTLMMLKIRLPEIIR